MTRLWLERTQGAGGFQLPEGTFVHSFNARGTQTKRIRFDFITVTEGSEEELDQLLAQNIRKAGREVMDEEEKDMSETVLHGAWKLYFSSRFVTPELRVT